jgi:hypothetical protein
MSKGDEKTQHREFRIFTKYFFKTIKSMGLRRILMDHPFKSFILVGDAVEADGVAGRC